MKEYINFIFMIVLIYFPLCLFMSFILSEASRLADSIEDSSCEVLIFEDFSRF